MTFLQAIILGIVQGLTEFIPISSTAHLVLVGRVMNLPLNAEQTTASMAVIQLGTLLAVLVYFAGDIWNITRAFVGDHLALLSGKRRVLAGGQTSVALSRDAWLGWLVIIGSIPVGIVGLLFKKQIEGTFTKSLWVIATMMIVVALLLAIAEVVGKKTRGMEELGIGDALAIGGAQVLSLIPGSSRSGSTIMAGLFAGETRETAARFSFLLSIPAIAASGLLELKVAIHSLPHDSLAALAVATVVSGIVGYASIWFLLRFLRTHTTGIFIGYRLILGVAILLLLFSGRIGSQSEPRMARAENNAVATGLPSIITRTNTEPAVATGLLNPRNNRLADMNSCLARVQSTRSLPLPVPYLRTHLHYNQPTVRIDISPERVQTLPAFKSTNNNCED